MDRTLRLKRSSENGRTGLLFIVRWVAGKICTRFQGLPAVNLDLLIRRITESHLSAVMKCSSGVLCIWFNCWRVLRWLGQSKVRFTWVANLFSLNSTCSILKIVPYHLGNVGSLIFHTSYSYIRSMASRV